MEMKAFDDAVKVAKDFAAKDGNTLVIATADHECAGFNIIGKGSFANAEAAAPPGNIDSGNTANNSSPSREFAANKKDSARSTGPVKAPARVTRRTSRRPPSAPLTTLPASPTAVLTPACG